MKRLLYVAPAFALIALSPKAVGILGAIVMIGGLIFLHELGHFLMAKRMGMPVKEFAWGLPFGPFITFFHWRETAVGIRPFAPLGGYVMLAGYNPEEPDSEDPHGFLQQPFGKRMLFYSGGILANVATTLVLLCFLGVDQSRATPHPLPSPLAISDVAMGMPAAQAGLKPGDQILSLDQLRFPGNGVDEAKAYIESHSGQPMALRVERNGQPMELTITPVNDGGQGRIGIVFGSSRVLYERRPITLRDLGRGCLGGVLVTGDMAVQVSRGFWKLVSFRASMKEVGGPIAIAKAGSDAAKAGWERFLFLCAFISMNLAVLNALPIPFLDGGHMAILCFEKLRRKDLTVQLKERILTGGFFFLATLMALVIAMDLWRLKH
jgi:regulator of sigma E protease